MGNNENIKIKDNEYLCAACGGIFEKGQTEEEALKEKEANGWGAVPMEDCDVVCDDCYKKIMNN